MADIPISGLPIAFGVNPSDQVPIVQNGTTKRASALLIAQTYTMSAVAANLVYAGPTSGASAIPSFRQMVTADLPQVALGSIYLGQGTSAAPVSTPNPVFGSVGGATGSIGLAGITSGVVTIKSNAVAGTWTATLPATAGTANQVLTTDGTGVLSWSSTAGGGAAGSNTQVQFNNAGAFGASANLTFASNVLSIGASGVTGQLALLGSGSGTTSIQAASVAGGTITMPASTTTLAGLSVTGQIFTTTQAFTAAINSITLGANSGNAGSATFFGSTSGSVSVKAGASAGASTLFQLPASNGTSGYYLQTDGTGVTSWSSVAATAAGSNTQLQFNLSGAFGASANLTWSSPTLSIGAQQVTQGQITLANTAAGAFSTTLASSNSSTAAWTMTLPVTAGTNGFVLTTNGSGVTTWTGITAGTLTGTTLASNVVSSSLTSVGTIASGTWQGTVIGSAYGGTGVANNAASTLAISGNFGTTLTVSGTTSVTLPTAGTLAVLGANTFTAGQTITQATANASVLTSTGYSLTGSAANSMIDLAGTWNTSGSPTALKINITNTASTGTPLLADFQVGGSSKHALRADGYLQVGGGFIGNGDGFYIGSSGGNGAFLFAGLSLTSTGYIGWSSTSNAASSKDLYLTRAAAAGLQFGAADAAAPVAQTTQVQSVVAGTTNTSGVDWTIKASAGTGTGAGGKYIIQTAPAGSTGSSQNAFATGLTITAPTVNMQPSVLVGNQAVATNATDGFLYIPTCAGTPTGTPTTQTGRIAMVYDTTNHQFWFYDSSWKQPKTPGGAATVTWQ